jgi:opacity protein-like surface antigen
MENPMTKFLAGAAFWGLLLTTPAVAADWNGFYVGANAGGGLGSGQFADGCYFCATDSFSQGFVAAGAQAGFNWQMGAAVFGAEADFDWTSFSRKGDLGTDDSTFLKESSKLEWFTSVRARAGLATDNAMVYITAGPVFGHIKAPGIEYCCGPLDTTLTASGNTFSTSGTRVGIIGGAGVEVMLTNNWSVRGEYLYADFGSKTAYRNPACTAPYLCTVQNTLNAHIARLAVNYRFPR